MTSHSSNPARPTGASDVELGQVLFGPGVVGEYAIDRSDPAIAAAWGEMCDRLRLNSYAGGDPEWHTVRGDVRIYPYCWCEHDDCPRCSHGEPNFWHVASGLKIWWYKYPFRSATMNLPLESKQIQAIFDSIR